MKINCVRLAIGTSWPSDKELLTEDPTYFIDPTNSQNTEWQPQCYMTNVVDVYVTKVQINPNQDDCRIVKHKSSVVDCYANRARW